MKHTILLLLLTTLAHFSFAQTGYKISTYQTTNRVFSNLLLSNARIEENDTMNEEILDLAKPLLFLAKRRKSRRKSKKDAQAIKAALRLWTTLYRDVLATRRRNILAQVYPRFMGLLEDASLFKGGDLLFGPKFVNKLVGHAQAQNTLKQIRPPPATNQHSARRSNDNRHSDKRQQDRRQHRGNYDGSINNSEYETIFLTFHKSCGGCTTRHIDAWQNNLHSPTQRNVCRAILFLFLRTMSLSFCTDFVSLPITTIFYLQ